MRKDLFAEFLSQLTCTMQTIKGQRHRRLKNVQSQFAMISLQQLESRVLLSVSDVEPNDRVVTAGDFGNLTDVIVENSVLGSISAHDTMDVYKFTVDRNRQAQIQLKQLTGSVFLKLSKDNDGDQVLRTFEEIENLTVAGDFTTIESLTPGTYFVTVLRNNSDVRTDYQLTIQVSDLADSELIDPGTRTNTATDLGELTNTPIARTEVVSAFDNDYYAFTLTTASRVTINVTGVDEDVEMVLGQDNNNDNILDVYEQANISSSLQTIETLGPGKYFLTFRSINTANANNNDNTDYQLQLSATALTPYSDAGSTLEMASGLVSRANPLQDILLGSDTDMYRFTVLSPSQVTIRINGVDEPIWAYLGQDSNNNGGFDEAEAIETRSTSAPTTFSRMLAVGTYYVYLKSAGSLTNTVYQISLEDTLPTNVSLSSQIVSEAANVGMAVGTFTATDPTGNTTLTYTLVSGTGGGGNSRFEIIGNELRTKSRFDFETSQSHSIRVRVTTSNGASIEKIFVITVSDVPRENDWIATVKLHGGVPIKDSAEGTGYLMYSEQSVRARFGSAVGDGNAEHFVAVQFENGSWRLANNDGWTTFTPKAGDRLIARLDFSLDTASLMTGQFGIINGIQHGISGGDLTITANRWYGDYNQSEFGLSGTYFIPGKNSTALGELKNGIAGKDDATGLGYVMFSQQRVQQRFSGSVDPGNADQLLAVQFMSGHWFYANDNQWVNFIPVSSDRLLARVDFENDTVELLQGQPTQYQGINAGFASSDLSIRPNFWSHSINPGEFGVTGTYWN